MTRRNIYFYFIILMVFCQVLGTLRVPVSAIDKDQEEAISNHCDTIKEKLKDVQREDAKVRVHLGGQYEAILSRFILPLNVKLVEKNLSNADFVENQNNFVDTKSVFANDYISYQQQLEELVAMDCETEPEVFYEKLVKVRQKRKTMEQDTMLMRNLISKNITLVKALKEKI